MNRREFLAWGAASSVLGASLLELASRRPDIGDGAVQHVLPTAGPDRLRLKVSLRSPASTPPILGVDGRRVDGVRTDAAGRFWLFDAGGLAPGRRHRLELRAGDDERPLLEPWELSTLPAPDATPDRFRLLVYTCAGGPDYFCDWEGRRGFLPIATRRRLLARALSFAPDAVIANGDHVYWDLRSRRGWGMGASPMARFRAGSFDREGPVLGSANEGVLTRAFGPQLADLYGTMLRGVPCFFLQDDHDYTENDEATDAGATFPADPFMEAVARATQRLYYPELLDHAGLPAPWPTAEGTSESFGLLRWGRLFEAVLYDCRRGLRGGADGVFIPEDVEAWVTARLAGSPARHLVQVPSTPVLWTAGKWGEWYPDAIEGRGRIGTSRAKPRWSEGWARQHDRLLAAAHARADRTPIFVSGDLHATALGRIHRAGALDAGDRPITSILAGSLGTGHFGWPSNFRDVEAQPSAIIEAEELVSPIEENGFCLLDATPDALRASLFRWTPADGEAAIDRLEPFVTVDVATGKKVG